MGLPDTSTHPICTACRTAGELRDHDTCTGCIGCGCHLSAKFGHWITDPANRPDR